MKRQLMIVLVLVAVAAGCGGKSSHSSSPRRAASGSTSASGAGSGATAGTPSDCNVLGINPTQMKEGTCTHAGITYTIVDENHTLKLKTLWVKLNGIHTAKSLAGGGHSATAQGQFLVASVNLINKLPAPQNFDRAQTQQAALILEGALFKEAVGAETSADPNSCPARNRTPIRSGQTMTCDVIFDISSTAVPSVGKHGSGDLYFADFGSDLSSNLLPGAVGQIRLYH